MRAAAGARTAAADGGAERIAQGAAVHPARVGYRQRQRVHERDRAGLLREGRGGVHALPPLSQERPGLGRAEERRCGPADGRLPPLRGPGSSGSPGAIICGDAAVREFLPAFVVVPCLTKTAPPGLISTSRATPGPP